MDITALHKIEQGLPSVATPIGPQQAGENRQVVQAVKALNRTEMFGRENDLVFQRDPQTQRLVIRVVDRRTKEVISQLPPEYVLRLAEDLGQSKQ
jgi:flagellar protein FlaG